MKLFILSLLFALSSVALAAADVAIEVETAWARESPPTVTAGAAYMTLINHSKDMDRLLAVSGEVASTLELHTHLMENNMMMMRPVEAIEVNPSEPVILEPGGLHIMLIGLEKPLVAGQTFPLTLHFEKAGKVAVQVSVLKKGEQPVRHSAVEQ